MRRIESFTYVVPVALPVLLLLDVAVAWRSQASVFSRPASDKLLVAACGVWLAILVGALLYSRTREDTLGIARRPLLAFNSLVIVLAVVEIVLRVFFPPPAVVPALREPGSRMQFVPAAAGIPITGLSQFTVNEIGLRGPSLPQGGATYKIVAVGNSTTENLFQDDTKEWPHLLMDEVNDRQHNLRVWVGNAGVSGHTTVHHLEVMRTLPVFADIQAVVMVIGQMDLGTTLASRGRSTQERLERDAAVLRGSMLAGGKPFFDHPYYKRLRLYEVAKGLGSMILGKDRSTESDAATGAFMQYWRKRRATAPVRSLPDLSTGLREYQQRIRALAAQCGRLKLRCVFATQPTLWRADLSVEEQGLLWGGRLGQPTESESNGYLSAADLDKAMRQWNRALLQVCEQDKLECFDLASRFPKDSSLFYDDAHVTDRGAQTYAGLLCDYFLSKSPFSVVDHSGTQSAYGR